MDERSGLLATPLGQFAAGAIGLILAATVLFALIGAVAGDDSTGSDTNPVATGTSEVTTGGSNAPSSDAASPEDPTTDTTSAPPSSTPPSSEPPSSEPPSSEPPLPPTIEPASITVQVLDGVPESTDNQDAVVACLQAAGYDSLITENKAARAYDTTTVFFTPEGENEAAAQQVAGEIGVATVEAKPDNLSDTVPVHIVVGRDADNPC